MVVKSNAIQAHFGGILSTKRGQREVYNLERIKVQDTLFPRLFSQKRFVNYKCLKTYNKDQNCKLVDLLSRASRKLVIAMENILELLSKDNTYPWRIMS